MNKVSGNHPPYGKLSYGNGGGNHREFRKLEKVWDLNGDPVKFDTYIQDEVRQFLNE